MEWLWKVDWAGVFEPKHGLLELFLRGTIMYLAIFVLLRVVVRRHLGGIGMTDILVIVLIAEVTGNGISENFQSIGESLVLVLTVLLWSTLIEWAQTRQIAVSIDVSSVSVIEALGVAIVRTMVERLAPDVVFANADEARVMDIDAAIGAAITIVKRGAGSATVLRRSAEPVDVPATGVDGVDDTTGAGDAFAAGVLTYRGWREDPEAACKAGHAAAANLLRERNER